MFEIINRKLCEVTFSRNVADGYKNPLILSDNADEIAFHCLITCCGFLALGLTEYSFLSQQSARYERKRAGY